jgi:4a-hydroxytetrahydrobiopterin dehydratase
MESIAFINRLAEIAEEANHHPDMVVGWCRIDVAFTSHDQGGVTLACIEMAKKANKC